MLAYKPSELICITKRPNLVVVSCTCWPEGPQSIGKNLREAGNQVQQSMVDQEWYCLSVKYIRWPFMKQEPPKAFFLDACHQAGVVWGKGNATNFAKHIDFLLSATQWSVAQLSIFICAAKALLTHMSPVAKLYQIMPHMFLLDSFCAIPLQVSKL